MHDKWKEIIKILYKTTNGISFGTSSWWKVLLNQTIILVKINSRLAIFNHEGCRPFNGKGWNIHKSQVRARKREGTYAQWACGVQASFSTICRDHLVDLPPFYCNLIMGVARWHHRESWSSPLFSPMQTNSLGTCNLICKSAARQGVKSQRAYGKN